MELKSRHLLNLYNIRTFQLSFLTTAFLLLGLLNSSSAQTGQLSAEELKKLSLEDLMNMEITSVSKKSERLSGAASAIQVITAKDIQSSGARTIPEALRLAPNLQVAQVNSGQWAVSARGFNNVLADKLLVLIDGRTVYTPLYAGVYWDVQNVLLEDVDRIEVISGPGGTLWGANAVNGVINIITKSAGETQGLLVEAGVGTTTPGLGSLRYGGQAGENLAYRVYGTGFKLGNTAELNGSESNDNWSMVQGGFQVDWKASSKDQLSLQQNVYSGRPNPDAGDARIDARGDNVLLRWNRSNSQKLGFQLQGYYDHTLRDLNNGLKEVVKTYDVDWNSQYQLTQKHALSFGAGFRYMDHEVQNLELFRFLPARKSLYLPSLYVQDEIALLKNALKFTIGSKVEHNSYTGFEFQPNARLAWTPGPHQTVWAAASRAVRTPARIDRDFYLNLSPDVPLISGNDNFDSEDVHAFELGWRLQPIEHTSISISTFYNTFDHLRTVEPLGSPYPVVFGNGLQGDVYGVELAANYQVKPWWNLRGGYTHVKKQLSVRADSKDLNAGSAESNDPANQFLFQSTMNLPHNLTMGTVFRYVDKLPAPYVPHYFGLDINMGWQLTKALALNVVGQNLLNRYHTEFIPSSPSTRQIQRSLYGKLTFRY